MVYIPAHMALPVRVTLLVLLKHLVDLLQVEVARGSSRRLGARGEIEDAVPDGREVLYALSLPCPLAFMPLVTIA